MNYRAIQNWYFNRKTCIHCIYQSVLQRNMVSGRLFWKVLYVLSRERLNSSLQNRYCTVYWETFYKTFLSRFMRVLCHIPKTLSDWLTALLQWHKATAAVYVLYYEKQVVDSKGKFFEKNTLVTEDSVVTWTDLRTRRLGLWTRRSRQSRRLLESPYSRRGTHARWRMPISVDRSRSRPRRWRTRSA